MTEPRTQAAGALWRLPVNARSHTSPLSPKRHSQEHCRSSCEAATIFR